MRVVNEDGETRVLGSYVVTGNAGEVLPIGRISYQPDETDAAGFEAQIVEENDQRAVRVAYRDSQATTETLFVEIYRYGNESNALIANTSYSVSSAFTGTYPLSGEPDNATYAVRYRADRAGAPDVGGKRLVGDAAEIGGQFNFDAGILSLLGYLTIVAVTGLVVILDVRELAPMTAVAVAGGLSALGIVAIPGVVLGFAGLGALLFAAAGGAGP